MGTGTFAVGSSDVDGLVFTVGIAEMVVKGNGVVESFLVGGSTDMLKYGRDVE